MLTSQKITQLVLSLGKINPQNSCSWELSKDVLNCYFGMPPYDTNFCGSIFRERETVLWFFELLMQTGGAQYCNYIFGLSAQCCNFSVGQDIRKFKKDTLIWRNCVTKYGMTMMTYYCGSLKRDCVDVQYEKMGESRFFQPILTMLRKYIQRSLNNKL